MLKNFFKSTLLYTLVIIFCWWLLAYLIADSLILPSPYDVIQSSLTIINQSGFYKDLTITIFYSISGLLISLVSGIVIGVLAGLHQRFNKSISPLVTVVQATPPISWLLIALLWFPSQFTAPFLIILSTMPIIIINTATGIHSTDFKLLEMARLYQVPLKKTFVHIYLPALKGYIESAAAISIGIAFKVGVMAEVLARSGRGIGERMAEAQLRLDMSALIFYTLVIITISISATYFFNRIRK